MDLNSIRASVATADREVEFVVNGKPTGWFFTLRHESSPEIQKLNRAYQSKVTQASVKGKKAEVQRLMDAHPENLRVAHVVTWRWADGESDGRPAFSEKELRAALSDDVLGYHLRQFLDQETGALDDFLEA